MNKYTIIPSNLKYKGSPSVDEKVSISLDQTSHEITEYDRSVTISIAQVYDDERQACTVFRPTFKVKYLLNCSSLSLALFTSSVIFGRFKGLFSVSNSIEEKKMKQTFVLLKTKRQLSLLFRPRIGNGPG